MILKVYETFCDTWSSSALAFRAETRLTVYRPIKVEIEKLCPLGGPRSKHPALRSFSLGAGWMFFLRFLREVPVTIVFLFVGAPMAPHSL